MNKLSVRAAAAALFLVLPLSACGEGAKEAEKGEATGDEPAEGPNGGRLLTDGDFAAEVTIFQDATAPHLRVYTSRRASRSIPSQSSSK